MTSLRAVVVASVACGFLFPAVLPVGVLAQMPPHPRIKQLVDQGQISMPYTLQHLDELRAQGVDGAWAAPALREQTQAVPGRPLRTQGPALAPSGSWRALVILVDFPDKGSKVTATSFDNLLFGTSYGSMRNYYGAVSYGALDIVTVHLPGTVGWQRAPQLYFYYVNNQNGTGAYPRNAQKLTEDVVNIANAVVDFSQYDNDGDGYVDALFIVHAGPGAEYTGSNSDIWSHAWTTSAPILLDGKYVYHYSIEPEYWVTPGDMTIGVYAHELGHAGFGLPDLYDTDYTSEGLGNWTLMAGGSWNGPSPGGASPAFPDAWSHAQMGYVAPTTVVANTPTASIRQMESYPDAWKLWTNGSPGTQYFMVENRQKTGYDSYLPGSGLLVYHVDESVTTDNDNEWYPGHTTSGHYLVALEQADGLWNLEKYSNSGDGADPFPGTGNKTSFSSTTTPDTKDYASAQTQVALRNISAPGATMTADLEISNTAPSLTLVSPNGGESVTAGGVYAIQWNAGNITGTVDLSYSTNNGSSWVPIANVGLSAPAAAPAATADTYAGSETVLSAPAKASAASTHSYSWSVPDVPSTQCLVRVAYSGPPALADQSDATFRILTQVTGLWGVQFNYNAFNVTGGDGNAGVVYLPDRSEFWTTRWGTSLFHRWSSAGTLLQEFSVSGVTGVRGLTYDGTYVYAGLGTTTISVINPSTRVQVSTISSPVVVRYITFDPTANSGAGGFWVGNFTTAVYLISRAGATLKTLPYASLNSIGNYGAAFDVYSQGGPYLWLFGQGGGSTAPQRIVQIDPATGLPTGIEHDVVTDVASSVSAPLAGGLFVAPGLAPHSATLGGMVQGTNNRLFGYYLTPLPSANVKARASGSIQLFRPRNAHHSAIPGDPRFPLPRSDNSCRCGGQHHDRDQECRIGGGVNDPCIRTGLAARKRFHQDVHGYDPFVC